MRPSAPSSSRTPRSRPRPALRRVLAFALPFAALLGGIVVVPWAGSDAVAQEEVDRSEAYRQRLIRSKPLTLGDFEAVVAARSKAMDARFTALERRLDALALQLERMEGLLLRLDAAEAAEER